MEVAKNLLKYRHNHLQKAKDNAELLGFSNGAALYPMVTMNGEECHNEWEITFEEIHRNGAIAYAIYRYINYTGDTKVLLDGCLEVLVGIARFWAQRVNWSPEKKQYVMLGVTGPNEYENNVNNNWYTNFIAKWCMQYTLETIENLRAGAASHNGQLSRIDVGSSLEHEQWRDIIQNIYLPFDDELGIYLQQDGYLDKENITIEDLPEDQRPINQKWSWDRILRSPYIKQADVLQGLYFFENEFHKDVIKANFDYYEPRTVHESSLSPCIHAILASTLGYKEKAYEMYLRTARLDLDDYNNDTEDGCHITSMAGTWMSLVEGFGGMRTWSNQLSFQPFIPKQWESYSFRILYRNAKVEVNVTHQSTSIINLSNEPINLRLYDNVLSLKEYDNVFC